VLIGVYASKAYIHKDPMRWTGIVFLLLTAGCNGGSEPAITTGEVVGLWRIALVPENPCERTHPAPSLTVDLTVLGGTFDSELTLMGNWELGPVMNPMRPLEGQVDLHTGRFTAELWREPPAGAPIPEARARLTGTIIDYGSLEGELEDPIEDAAGIFGTGTCRYEAVGQR
jgi:hypothetical protein